MYVLSSGGGKKCETVKVLIMRTAEAGRKQKAMAELVIFT